MALPEGWERKTLRQLAQINYGRSPAGILADDGPYPVVGTGGAERAGTDYLYDGDSIILGRKGTIDRVHFVSGRFWTIDTAYYLSHFHDVLPRWLYYFLQTLDLRQLNEATGVPSLSRELLYTVPVTTPPEPEQEKIAEVISTVDLGIDQTEGLITKQQRIRTGLLQDLLTRGIGSSGEIRSQGTHGFKDSPLGRIPAEWQVTTLRDAVASAVDGPFGSNLKSEHYVPEPGVRVLRLGNIGTGEFLDEDKAFVSAEHARALSRHAVTYGDILIASLGDDQRPFGRACLYPARVQKAIVKADVFRVRCRPEKYFHPFAVHLFNLPLWRKGLFALAQGVTRDRVNLTNLLGLALPMPPIDEQKVIAAMIDAMTASVVQGRAQLTKLKSLKAALMQDLLPGRKAVIPLLGANPAPTTVA